MEYTPNTNLYKWKKEDTKLDTITQMAGNSDKIDTKFKEQDDLLTEVQAKSTEALATATDVRSEFDQIVAEAGSNNPEVVSARGGEVNLNARLEKFLSQLEEKLTKGESGSITWAMASQDFREQITGGNTAVVGVDAVIEENIGNGAVSYKKTNFLQPSKNLFDKSKAILNAFLNPDGTTSTLSGYYTSDYIYLPTGKSFTMYPVRSYELYNLDKTNITGGANTGNNNSTVTITTTQDCLLRVSLSSANLNTCQIEEGTVVTAYEPFVVNFPNLAFTEQQKNKLTKPNNGITVVKSGESFTLTSKFNQSKDITIETTRNGSSNGAFNFVRTKIGADEIHTIPDDITPIRTFSTVGANHGYTCVVGVTMVGHGKTTADLGSKWTDGITTYTLLKISGDVLTFGCPYTVNGSGIVSSSKVNPTATLTHVSGATNTGSVTITTLTSPQLYPSINKISVKYVLDGYEITSDGTYYGKELQVIESYNIMDYKSIIDYAQANIGVSYANDNVEGSVKIANTFTFTDGLKCTTSHVLSALKKVSFGQCGFLQSVAINALSGHTRKRFMPNVLVKSGFDFAAGVNLDTYATSLLFTDADYANATIPPNHYVDWAYDSTSKKAYGFTMGYVIDKTNSKNADRLNNAVYSWDMRNSKKSYPIAIEGITLEAGQRMNFMGFRNYLSPEEVGNATNLNVVKDKKDHYVYVDVHETVTGLNKQLNDAIGKSISLLQGNITMLNDVVDSDGVVFSSAATVGNGVIKAS